MFGLADCFRVVIGWFFARGRRSVRGNAVAGVFVGLNGEGDGVCMEIIDLRYVASFLVCEALLLAFGIVVLAFGLSGVHVGRVYACM